MWVDIWVWADAVNCQHFCLLMQAKISFSNYSSIPPKNANIKIHNNPLLWLLSLLPFHSNIFFFGWRQSNTLRHQAIQKKNKNNSLEEKAFQKVHIIPYNKQQGLGENEVQILEEVRDHKMNWIHGLCLTELEHSNWGNLAPNLSRDPKNKRDRQLHEAPDASTWFGDLTCHSCFPLSPVLVISFTTFLIVFVSWGDVPVMPYTQTLHVPPELCRVRDFSSLCLHPIQFSCLPHSTRKYPSFILKDDKFRHWQDNTWQVSQNQTPQVNPFLLEPTVGTMGSKQMHPSYIHTTHHSSYFKL